MSCVVGGDSASGKGREGRPAGTGRFSVVSDRLAVGWVYVVRMEWKLVLFEPYSAGFK